MLLIIIYIIKYKDFAQLHFLRERNLNWVLRTMTQTIIRKCKDLYAKFNVSLFYSLDTSAKTSNHPPKTYIAQE